MLICICYHLLPRLPCKGQQKGAVHAQPDNILVEFIVIFVLTTIWIELVVCCLQFSYYGEIIQRQNSAANHAASVVLLFRFSFLNVSRQQWGNLQRKVSALHHFPVLVFHLYFKQFLCHNADCLLQISFPCIEMILPNVRACSLIACMVFSSSSSRGSMSAGASHTGLESSSDCLSHFSRKDCG